VDHEGADQPPYEWVVGVCAWATQHHAFVLGELIAAGVKDPSFDELLFFSYGLIVRSVLYSDGVDVEKVLGMVDGALTAPGHGEAGPAPSSMRTRSETVVSAAVAGRRAMMSLAPLPPDWRERIAAKKREVAERDSR
jgi:hypothetical protein